MQNTPPVARGGLLWAVQQSWGRSMYPRALSALLRAVKRRLRHPGWTVEELQEVTADVDTVLATDPEIPHPSRLRRRARQLQALGIPFTRVAELLGVREEQLLHAAPVVPDRPLWLPSTVISTRVRRLREEDWS